MTGYEKRGVKGDREHRAGWLLCQPRKLLREGLNVGKARGGWLFLQGMWLGGEQVGTSEFPGKCGPGTADVGVLAGLWEPLLVCGRRQTLWGWLGECMGWKERLGTRISGNVNIKGVHEWGL